MFKKSIVATEEPSDEICWKCGSEAMDIDPTDVKLLVCRECNWSVEYNVTEA